MLEPGLEATVEETVTEEMTAERLGSGDVPVLGTPAVLALVEAAAVAAVSNALEASDTTVGESVELEHLAPTAVGAPVTATAGLVELDGRRLRFSFEVTDPAGPIARGTHVRVLVDRERFLAGARDRSG
ncbi:MAG: thioesterase family protein [Actinomycetota bacterium]